MAKRRPSAAQPSPGEPAPPDDLGHITADLRPLAVELASLVLDPRNARKHDEPNLASIVFSLREFGQRRPAVVHRETRQILAGNGMTIAAQRLGWSKIAAIFVDDDPAAATGYAIADNRTAELAGWNDLLLAEAIAEIKEASPELADALLLDALLAPPPADVPEIEPQTNLAVLIEHLPSEAEQRRLFDSLVAQGLKVKVLTT